jgi:hypothetical protein
MKRDNSLLMNSSMVERPDQRIEVMPWGLMEEVR